MSHGLTNGDQPQSGLPKPKKVRRPPAHLKLAAVDGDSPLPAEVSEVPRNVGPAASAQSGAADATAAPVGPRNWAQELAAQAQKSINPLTGLLTQLTADQYQSACDLKAAAKKLLSETSSAKEAFKVLRVTAHQESLLCKQLTVLVRLTDEFQQRDHQPLRGPYISVATGKVGTLQ